MNNLRKTIGSALVLGAFFITFASQALTVRAAKVVFYKENGEEDYSECIACERTGQCVVSSCDDGSIY